MGKNFLTCAGARGPPLSCHSVARGARGVCCAEVLVCGRQPTLESCVPAEGVVAGHFSCVAPEHLLCQVESLMDLRLREEKILHVRLTELGLGQRALQSFQAGGQNAILGGSRGGLQLQRQALVLAAGEAPVLRIHLARFGALRLPDVASRPRRSPLHGACALLALPRRHCGRHGRAALEATAVAASRRLSRKAVPVLGFRCAKTRTSI